MSPTEAEIEAVKFALKSHYTATLLQCGAFYFDGEAENMARAAIAAMSRASPTREQSGWMPIESAPRDGTRVDLWAEGYGRKPDMYWRLVERHKTEGWTDDWYGRGALFGEGQFTHWQPLPPPPTALNPSEGEKP